MKYALSNNTWDRREIRAIKSVIRSNKFTMGEKTKEFEQNFAHYFGSKFAIMVNSGSSANLLAVAALIYSGRLNKGDEVIVPAVSWSTSYYPLFQHGLKLKFVDIDLGTLNINLSKIEKAITNKTKAIFAVNLLGNPNEFDKLTKICKENDLILIEDNCEALGAKFKNKYCGTYGLLGTFSTFYSHHICTMEGGVVVTDDEELYHYMLSLRAHGWTRDIPEGSKLYQKSQDDFYESFYFILPGYNLRPLEIEAAVGIEQIKKISKIVEIRRKNAAIFRDIFSDNNNIGIQEEIGNSSWFGFAVIFRNDLENKRKQIVRKLINNGIEVRPIVAGNFIRNTVINYMDYEVSGNLTNADYIHNNGFFVGNHSKDISKEIKYFARILKEIKI
ncbi:MAG: DegT/DnrJ/EryC1/StrS family aminotransferase [Candidatus Marinimicrobia bacterium]|nr:DegT/DnrJ/EryC1/StrS family aminotransferase [Candidatus Neomarinimicrobiota bacterium]